MTLISHIQKEARAARWAGIAMIIAGVLALLAPLAAGLSIALLVGVMLLIGGIAYLVLVFRSGSLARGAIAALVGGLSLIAGIYCITQPVAALAALTIVLAIYFVAAGLLEIFAAISARPENGWKLLLITGIVSLLLGLLIWAQFPLSGVWAVGVLVGARLLITGWTMTSIAGAAIRLTDNAGAGA